MIRDELDDLLSQHPFEPFHIKLVNGDAHDVFDPQTVAVQSDRIMIASHDMNWVVFTLDKINSLESLFADYHGKAPA